MTDTRVAAVTGAGAGIGRACAEGLAAKGLAVAAVDRDLPTATATVEAIRAAGGRAEAVAADVSSSAEVDAMVETVVERLGGLDVLVNNAAIFRTAPVVETTDEVWAETIATNLSGVFYCCRAAARRMVGAGTRGRLINVTSLHAAVSEPSGGAYTATKAGVEGFSRTLASELAPHGITVNCVRPGATWTKLTEPIYSPEVVAALEQRIPLGEIAQPEWVAATVMFFADESSRYATGSVLTVDGGYSMDGGLPGLAYTHEEP